MTQESGQAQRERLAEVDFRLFFLREVSRVYIAPGDLSEEAGRA